MAQEKRKQIEIGQHSPRAKEAQNESATPFVSNIINVLGGATVTAYRPPRGVGLYSPHGNLHKSARRHTSDSSHSPSRPRKMRVSEKNASGQTGLGRRRARDRGLHMLYRGTRAAPGA